MRPFDSKIEIVPLSSLSPAPTNARLHDKKQIEMIARSIRQYGWTNPLLVDENGQVLSGHGRLDAARLLGLFEVPVLRFSHLTDAEKRAYALADNRLAEKARWDTDILAIELEALANLDIDVEITGFDTAEIDIIIDAAKAADNQSETGPEDAIPPTTECAVTNPGDLWLLGRHRLLCSSALSTTAVDDLLRGEAVDGIFTDPPYNTQIIGNVRRSGNHREFPMASGEMTNVEFLAFLASALASLKHSARDGSIAFVTIDWRHLGDLLRVAEAAGLTLKNICVWVKTNGGMGSLYRSQHELVCVFKIGSAPHINNIELGASGRNRTNVWTYAGVNTFKADRDQELAMHPTCKPVAMVQHAIEDVTRRNAIILDLFAGSGTTLIAAERCGRRARLIELDPLYCDVILRRYLAYTGKQPTLAITGETFEDVAAARATDTSEAS